MTTTHWIFVGLCGVAILVSLLGRYTSVFTTSLRIPGMPDSEEGKKKAIKNAFMWGLTLACVLVIFFVFFPWLPSWISDKLVPWGVIVLFLLLGTFALPAATFKSVGTFLLKLGIVFVLWTFIFWMSTGTKEMVLEAKESVKAALGYNVKPVYTPEPGIPLVIPSRQGKRYTVKVPLAQQCVRLGIDLEKGETVVVEKIEPVGVSIPPVRMHHDSNAVRLRVAPFGGCKINGSDTTYIGVQQTYDYTNWTQYRRAEGHLYMNDDFIIGAPMFVINEYPHIRPYGTPLVPSDTTAELLACANLKRSGGRIGASGYYNVTFEIVKR